VRGRVAAVAFVERLRAAAFEEVRHHLVQLAQAHAGPDGFPEHGKGFSHEPPRLAHGRDFSGAFQLNAHLNHDNLGYRSPHVTLSEAKSLPH